MPRFSARVHGGFVERQMSVVLSQNRIGVGR